MNNDLLLILSIIGVVLLILNVIFLGIIFFMRRKVAAVNQWPSTMGTVLMSTLERRYSSDSGSVDYPVIQYSYQVGRQRHQGTRLAPGPEVGGTGAGKVVARYPAGAQVMVFYNPQNPAEAILERKAPAQWIIWLILIVFDLALCGVIPLLWWAFQQ